MTIKQSTKFADNDIHRVYTFLIGSSGSEAYIVIHMFSCRIKLLLKKKVDTNRYFVSNKFRKRNHFPYSFVFIIFCGLLKPPIEYVLCFIVGAHKKRFIKNKWDFCLMKKNKEVLFVFC